MPWPALNRAQAAHAPAFTLEKAAPGENAANTESHSSERLDPDSLLKRHLAAVHRYAAARVPSAEAEDVTAAVFGDAIAALPRFRNQCSPRAWLLGIARRKVIDILRRRDRRPEVSISSVPHELAADLGDVSDSTLRGEARTRIRQIVDSLPERQREALLLQYVDELSISEIATVIGKSPGAVNSLLQRARASVYQAGESYFIEGDEASK